MGECQRGIVSDCGNPSTGVRAPFLLIIIPRFDCSVTLHRLAASCQGLEDHGFEQKNKLGIFLLICWCTWACFFADTVNAVAFICPSVGGLMMLCTFRRQKAAPKPKCCN